MDAEMLKSKVEIYVVADKQEKSSKSDKEGVRGDIIQAGKDLKPEDEKSVVLDGLTGNVRVTFAESFNIKPSASFVEAYKSGKYPQIKKSVSLSVLPENSDEVIMALVKAGLIAKVSVVESYEFDTKKKIASKDFDEVLKKSVDVVPKPSLTVVSKEKEE